jgi:tetratricopeptide (TPR) repeat protein
MNFTSTKPSVICAECFTHQGTVPVPDCFKTFGLLGADMSASTFQTGDPLPVTPHVQSAGAFRARGSIWLWDGNYPKAIEDFRKSLAENGASLEARGLLAACRLLSADRKGFEEEETAARAVNPKAAAFYHTVATALEHRFRYVDAVRMCDRALELDPDYWPAYATLAINCLRTGDNARGVQSSSLNDSTIEPVARKYAELRYQLLPYTYTLAWEARATGMPLMRALWLHYPTDATARATGSEYLWGRDLLVAPVFTKGATSRDVYLPAGTSLVCVARVPEKES